MKIIKGNLLDLLEDRHFDIIIHGCNCFHKMGAGIAKEIKKRYPDVYKADKKFSEYGSREKLGKYTYYNHISNDRNFYIINAYTQYYYGYGLNKRELIYNSIRKSFKKIRQDFIEKDNRYYLKIGYPAIGSGLAGGYWTIISSIIDVEFNGLDHTLVVLK